MLLVEVDVIFKALLDYLKCQTLGIERLGNIISGWFSLFNDTLTFLVLSPPSHTVKTCWPSTLRFLKNWRRNALE